MSFKTTQSGDTTIVSRGERCINGCSYERVLLFGGGKGRVSTVLPFAAATDGC